jgi:hypothetical protein
MVFLLPFQFLQIVIESIQAGFPDVAVTLGPVRHLFERACINPARPPLGLAPSRNQAGALEHPQVLRDRGHAHVERFGELGDRAFTGYQPRQNRSPCRIRQGGKGGA